MPAQHSNGVRRLSALRPAAIPAAVEDAVFDIGQLYPRGGLAPQYKKLSDKAELPKIPREGYAPSGCLRGMRGAFRPSVRTHLYST